MFAVYISFHMHLSDVVQNGGGDGGGSGSSGSSSSVDGSSEDSIPICGDPEFSGGPFPGCFPVNDNDPSFRYSKGWNLTASNPDGSGTVHSTSSVGDTVLIPFNSEWHVIPHTATSMLTCSLVQHPTSWSSATSPLELPLPITRSTEALLLLLDNRRYRIAFRTSHSSCRHR